MMTKGSGVESVPGDVESNEVEDLEKQSHTVPNGVVDNNNAEKLEKQTSNATIDSIDRSIEKLLAENSGSLREQSIPNPENDEDLPLPPIPPPTVTFDTSVSYLESNIDGNDSPSSREDVEQVSTSQNSGIFDIEPNTPAYYALNANAEVRVTKFSKITRKAKIPAVRKFIKNTASLKGPHHSKRGKPPRVPFHASMEGVSGRLLSTIVATSSGKGENDEEADGIEIYYDDSNEENAVEEEVAIDQDVRQVERMMSGWLGDTHEAPSDKNSPMANVENRKRPDPSFTSPNDQIISVSDDKDSIVSAKISSKEKKQKNQEKESDEFPSRKWKRSGRKKKKKKDRTYVKGKVSCYTPF